MNPHFPEVADSVHRLWIQESVALNTNTLVKYLVVKAAHRQVWFWIEESKDYVLNPQWQGVTV